MLIESCEIGGKDSSWVLRTLPGVLPGLFPLYLCFTRYFSRVCQILYYSATYRPTFNPVDTMQLVALLRMAEIDDIVFGVKAVSERPSDDAFT